MDLLYCMPTSLHCSHKRSHSPSSHFSRPIFKKKKHVHDFSPTTLEQQVHEQTKSKQNQNCSKSSKNDITRINDMDIFLAEENNNEGLLSDYILLHDDKDKHLANVKLKNGFSLPMERRKGETKFRIPDFVLNNNNNMTSLTTTTTTNRALIRYQDSSIINIEKRTRQNANDGEEERMMDVDYNYNSNSNSNNNDDDEEERNNSYESIMSMEID